MIIARIGFILGLLILLMAYICCSDYNKSSYANIQTLIFSDTVATDELSAPYVLGNFALGTDSLILLEGIFWFYDTNYPDNTRIDTLISAIGMPDGTVFQWRNNEWLMHHPYGRRFTNVEYLSPFGLSSLNPGDYLIYDVDSLSIVVYDSLGHEINSIYRSLVMPYSIFPGTDSVAVIKELGHSNSRQYVGTGYRIFSVNLYTGEEIAVFRNYYFSNEEYPEEMCVDCDFDITDYYSVYTVDKYGNVYISDYSAEESVIWVYNPAGELVQTIQFDSSLRLEYDHDVYWIPEAPITFFYPQGDCLGRIALNYPKLHPYVTRLEILDDEIWARRSGTRSTEYWDVISMEGELLRRVTLYAEDNEIAAYPMLVFNGNGYFAIYREDSYDRCFTVKNLND